MALSLGGLLARANSSSHQAEVRAKEQQALTDELAMVKEQMAKQTQRFFIQEASLTEEMGVLQKAELEANKRLHDEGQKYTTLLTKVVPLRAEITELKVVAASNQVKMTNLECEPMPEQCSVHEGVPCGVPLYFLALLGLYWEYPICEVESIGRHPRVPFLQNAYLHGVLPYQ